MLSARRWLIVAIAVSFRAVPSLADARGPDTEALGTMSLEELMQMRIDTVYGASKYEQKVTRAPASVTIVTADDISRFGYRTLAEALRSIRGLYVSDDRNYSYLGTRGFLRPGDYNSRILMLIDGHRVNDNVYDGAYFGREAPVAVDMIERIEFVRGPSSPIYGSSAFFGIVNIVLKHAQDIDGAGDPAAGGSLGAREGTFQLGNTSASGVESTLAGSWFESRGHGFALLSGVRPGCFAEQARSQRRHRFRIATASALGVTGQRRAGRPAPRRHILQPPQGSAHRLLRPGLRSAGGDDRRARLCRCDLRRALSARSPPAGAPWVRPLHLSRRLPDWTPRR